MRRRTAALAAAAATIAVGVATGSAPGQDTARAMRPPTWSPGSIDASPYPPLERLGRWDGTSLVPVGAGSIDTAQVVVITHGWEPGFVSRYDGCRRPASR